jgi:hypothetical protein
MSKPASPVRLLQREVAAAYVGVSPNTFDDLVARGVMPKPRVLPGTRRKPYDIRDLDRAIDALPYDGGEDPAADHGWS